MSCTEVSNTDYSSTKISPPRQRSQWQCLSHFVKTFLKLEQQLAPATWVCFASLRKGLQHFFDMGAIVAAPIDAVEESAECRKLDRLDPRCYRRDMADTSATFAPNRCFLANTGGTSIPIGCCENDRHVRKDARKDYFRRARHTTTAGTCPRHGKLASAADCRRCR